MYRSRALDEFHGGVGRSRDRMLENPTTFPDLRGRLSVAAVSGLAGAVGDV